MSLNDLMNRYNPCVPRSRYTLRFVPVVEDGRDEGRERERVGGRKGREREGEEDSCVGLEGSEGGKGSGCRERLKGHLLRTTSYCWCDRETKMMMEQVCMVGKGGRVGERECEEEEGEG